MVCWRAGVRTGLFHAKRPRRYELSIAVTILRSPSIERFQHWHKGVDPRNRVWFQSELDVVDPFAGDCAEKARQFVWRTGLRRSQDRTESFHPICHRISFGSGQVGQNGDCATECRRVTGRLDACGVYRLSRQSKTLNKIASENVPVNRCIWR
jgi:hypothetical protein